MDITIKVGVLRCIMVAMFIIGGQLLDSHYFLSLFVMAMGAVCGMSYDRALIEYHNYKG